MAQWLGKTSYSLYLWHWPLAVALVHAGWYGEPLPTITAFLATLLLGWLSWKFIENKSKDLIGRLSIKNGYLLICSSVFMLCLIAASIFLKDGLSFRNQKAFEVYKEKFNKNPQQKDCHVSGLQTVPECIYGNNDLGIIVIGDSHADAVIRSIEKSMQIHEKGVLDWTLSSCQTIVGLKKDDTTYRCGDQVSMFLEKQKEINTKIPILIVNRTGGLVSGPTKFEESQFDEKDIKFIDKSNKNNKFLRDREILKGITETACSFAKNRKVYMMRPIPEMNEDVPSYMEKEIMRGREYARVSISLDEYYKRHQKVMQAQDEAAEKCGVTLLDPVPYLCSEGRCWGDRDGLPIYYDDDHLNERGGALLIPLFQQIANDIDMAK